MAGIMDYLSDVLNPKPTTLLRFASPIPANLGPSNTTAFRGGKRVTLDRDGNVVGTTPTKAPAPTPKVSQNLSNYQINSTRQALIDYMMKKWSQISPVAAKQAFDIANHEGLNRDPGFIQKTLNDYIPELGRRSWDYGTFQVNDWWQRNNLAKYGYTIDDMLDPYKNIDFIYNLYKAQGNKWGNLSVANKKLFQYE